MLAHHVLSIWTYTVTQRLVIQFNKLGHFCALRLVRAQNIHPKQKINSKLSCYF